MYKRQIQARVDETNRLEIVSNSENLKFFFGTDTSGFLAAIGLNTFFTGTDGLGMGVNEVVEQGLEYLAAGKDISPGDNANALELAALRDRKVLQSETMSLTEYYQALVGTLGVQTSEANFRLEHQELLTQQLENQRQRISGVNLDEEAMNMLVHQRAFQAAARFLATVDAMLEVLMTAF